MMSGSGSRLKSIIFLWTALSAVGSHQSLAKTVSVLINGGGSPVDNHCDFYRDLDAMASKLKTDEIYTFTDDGQGKSGAPNSVACDAKNNDIEGLYGPVLVRKAPTIAPVTGPATNEALEKKVLELSKSLQCGDTLIWYATDHGEENGTTLWGDSNLDDGTLKGLIDKLKPCVRLEIISDHCFGENRYRALYDKNKKLRPNTCGFTAASGSQTAALNESIAQFKNEPGDLKTLIHGYEKTPRESTPLSLGDTFLRMYWQDHKKTLESSALTSQCLVEKNGIPPKINQSLLDTLKTRLVSNQEDFMKSLNAAPEFQAQLKDKKSSDLIELIRSKQAQKVAAESEVAQAENEIDDIKAQYYFEKMGPSYEELLKLTEQRDQLEAEAANLYSKKAIPLSEAQKNGAALAAVKAKLETLNAEMKQVTPPDSEFTDELKKLATRTPTQNPYTRKDKNSALQNKLEKELTTLRNIRRYNANRDSLNYMIANNDVEAINQYLGILNCEENPIFK